MSLKRTTLIFFSIFFGLSISRPASAAIIVQQTIKDTIGNIPDNVVQVLGSGLTGEVQTLTIHSKSSKWMQAHLFAFFDSDYKNLDSSKGCIGTIPFDIDDTNYADRTFIFDGSLCNGSTSRILDPTKYYWLQVTSVSNPNSFPTDM